MASDIVFYALNSEAYGKYCFDPDFELSPIVKTILPIIPAVFLSIAGFLNLNNWILYYIKIGQMASIVDQRAQKIGQKEYIVRLTKILNIITTILIVAVIVTGSALIIHSNMSKDNLNPQWLFAQGIIFTIIGLTFGISGILMLNRLKKYFNKFLVENLSMLVLAISGLSIPLILRGILNLIRHFSEAFQELIATNQIAYDIITFIVEIMPLCF